MRYFISLAATFVLACVGWSFIAEGPMVLGVAVLGLCFSFAYWVSIYMAFGSFSNFVQKMEELWLLMTR